MKTEKIKAERLQKYTSALNEMNSQIKSGIYTTDSLKEVSKKYKINLALLSFAVKVGLFNKIDRGVYSCRYNVIEPYQSINVLNEVNKENREYAKRKSEIMKDVKKNYTKIKINSITEKEAISYLKGLGYKIMKPIQQFEEI